MSKKKIHIQVYSTANIMKYLKKKKILIFKKIWQI